MNNHDDVLKIVDLDELDSSPKVNEMKQQNEISTSVDNNISFVDDENDNNVESDTDQKIKENDIEPDEPLVNDEPDELLVNDFSDLAKEKEEKLKGYRDVEWNIDDENPYDFKEIKINSGVVKYKNNRQNYKIIFQLLITLLLVVSMGVGLYFLLAETEGKTPQSLNLIGMNAVQAEQILQENQIPFIMKNIKVDDEELHGKIVIIEGNTVYSGFYGSHDGINEFYKELIGEKWDVAYNSLWDAGFVEDWDYQIVSKVKVSDRNNWIVKNVDTSGHIVLITLKKG